METSLTNTILYTVLLLVGVSHQVFGFNISMEILPDKVDDLTPANNLTISCLVTASPHLTREVLVLEIGKVGENAIAVLHQNSNLTLRKGLENRFSVDEFPQRNSSFIFIRVTLLEPTVQDAGKYFCLVYSLDENGALAEEKVKAALSVNKLDISTVIKHFSAKIDNLEKSVMEANNIMKDQRNAIDMLKDYIKRQDSTLQGYKKKLSEQATELKKHDSKLRDQDIRLRQHDKALHQCTKTLTALKQDVSKQEKSMKSQQSQIDAELSRIKTNADRIEYVEQLARNQSRLITKVNNKGSTIEAFTALYDKKDIVSNGHTLIFSKVELNEGKGYDEKTGIFKVSVPGLYVFHLSISTEKSSALDKVDIVVNDKPQAKVFAYDTDLYPEQSSVSCVVKLQEGDIVRVAVLNRSSYSKYLYSDPYYSVFSGYLLKEL